MRINRAIVSADSNPLYYEFWPIVAKAWRNIGPEPTAAVIGNLYLDHTAGTLIKVPLVEGIPTGFISQVIRLIIPCFFPEEVCIIGDIDMIPLNKDYFTSNVADYDDESIIIFSADAYKDQLRYPMCYIAAKGKYFQEIIGLENTEEETIKKFIQYLFSLNKNWDTDELFFTEQLHRSALLKKTIFLKRGWNPRAKQRIDRVHWQYNKLGLILNKYIDSHSLRPLHAHTRQLKNITSYIDLGSDGKKYFYHLIKKPVRQIINSFKLLKQNFLDKSFYNIAEEKGYVISKKNIISFSLYGTNSLYTKNLNKVIRSYHNVYPDWKCRVYLAKDVDPKHIQLLISEQCEVIIMDSEGIDARYTNWRFLAIEDKNAEAVIVRDLDSLATSREKIMVDQWLSSEKKFHIIRDHVNHNAIIMAGLWGIKKNNIDIRKLSRKILMTDSYGIDQLFLEKLIYPLVKDDVMVHDSFPRFPEENPIIIPIKAKENHVGEILTVA